MSEPIAIVGMACRYPDAHDLTGLWETVVERRRAFRRLPRQRLDLTDYWHPDPATPDTTYSTQAAVLTDWQFDRAAFRIPGQVFRATDPAHWLALETASRALADAGHPDVDPDRVGVVVGNSLTGEVSRANTLRLRWPYVRRVLTSVLPEPGRDALIDQVAQKYLAPFPPVGDETLAGGLANTIAGRICNHFDFHGGGYTVDGACASSMLAVITMCRALRDGDIDFGIAGGVDLSLDPFELVGFAKTGALAADEMRIYDERPTGFWPGEGCGMLALMRADDARAAGIRAYAEIRGWGVSSDGHGGITRPEVAGQVLALRRASTMAGIAHADVRLYEGHGTGTAVGDLVELTALNQVRGDAPAAIGSVKANIGHTKAAAGVAGVIKTALSLAGDLLPPTTGCAAPHPALGTLRILDAPEPWPAGPRFAGVSAMGFGGINTHLLLAREPDRPVRAVPRIEVGQPAPPVEVLALSGRDTTQVRDLLHRIATLAPQLSQAELHDLACHHGRLTPAGRVRVALTARTPDELATKAAAAVERLPEPGHLSGGWLGNDVPGRVTMLFPGQGTGADVDTALAQPAIHRAGQAAIDWLDRLGVTPVAAIGHSLGEITALVWAGCLSTEDAMRLVLERGRIMAELGAPDTGMLSVATDSADELCRGTGLVVAAYNGPRSLVLAGRLPELRIAAERSGRATMLPVSHAFHSPAMARCVEPLRAVLDTVTFRPPSRTVLSTVYGRALREDDDLRELLATQLLAPVLFGPAIDLAAPDTDLFCTLGPGQHTVIPTVHLDLRQPAEAAAALFAASAVKDLAPLFAGRSARPFDIWRDPTFLTNPCAIDAPAEAVPVQRASSVIGLIADAVELDPALIRSDTRLLDELNLGSLRTTQLLTDAATALGRQSPAAWGAIADLTVADVIATIEGLPAATDDATVAGVRPWLGCFTEAMKPAVLGPWQPTERVYLPDATDIDAVLAAGRTALRAKALVVITPDSALTGFLRSLWLEHPEIGITLVRGHQDSAAYHAEPGRWRELVVGQDGIAREPVERLLPEPTATGPLPLTDADVLLVSGGGRGIGYECAQALAMASGAALAIIGRADPDTDGVLHANLGRLRANGIRVVYRSADVSRPTAAVAALAAELGPVTAILHAGGVNEPTTFDRLDAASVRRHVEPKVAGLRALLAAVTRPRLVVTFGSVIGRFGLPGECHYALANGILRVEAEQLAARLPACRVLHIDWSVWAGTGMGERLGVMASLNRNGITPIPIADGTDLLLRLLRTPTDTAVAVHGRLGTTPPPTTTGRFLQQIRVHEPDIELVADSELAIDPDLAGHRLDGATVLPGVLGLEAMAQAASTVAGRALTTAERVTFEHPILVPTTVRVCALRRDDVIETVLRSAETGYRVDHFRAEFPLSSKQTSDPIVVEGGDEVPAADLYGPVFFHTGRFQRIASVFLPGPKACRAAVTEDEPWFASVLGAPTVNDATIHVLQACVPHRRLLPVGCDRVEIDPGAGGPLELHGVERRADSGTYNWDVVATNRSGRQAIRWTGLRLRDVGPLPRDRPWPPALLTVYLARCALGLGLDRSATACWAPVGPEDESAARATAMTRCLTKLGLPPSDWRRTGTYDGGWVVCRSDRAVIASVVLTVVGPGTVAVALAVRR